MEKLYTVEQLSELVGLSKDAIWRLLRGGKLEYVDVSSRNKNNHAGGRHRPAYRVTEAMWDRYVNLNDSSSELVVKKPAPRRAGRHYRKLLNA